MPFSLLRPVGGANAPVKIANEREEAKKKEENRRLRLI